MKKIIISLMIFIFLIICNSFEINARGLVIICPNCANAIEVINVYKRDGEVAVKCSHFPKGKDYLFRYQYYQIADCDCGYHRETIVPGKDFTSGYRCEGYN